ncbi:MAG: 30S ribosomal protein S27ae [Candidatus Bathyarchaeota archaeon]|nr:30S ribosomal protein S27ae [Candidatus Bathyarchaeota archaeon A05DMB-3]MDH7606280.1 30S ribosomal protein S27ae [Candidatus Bathyarchaeota archaeon]
MSENVEEARKEEEAKKGKAEKRKRKEKGVFTLYKVEKDKIVRQRPTCERCGPGYFMADHGDRYSCGHCGFTRYKHT